MEPKVRGLVEKVLAAAQEIAEEQGPFSLVAMTEREDGGGLWDILMSSLWLRLDWDSMYRVTRVLIPSLTQEEALMISRVVPLDPDSEVVRYLQSLYQDEGGSSKNIVRLNQPSLGGVEIRRGYILFADTAKAEAMAA